MYVNGQSRWIDQEAHDSGDRTVCMVCYVIELCVLGIECYVFKTFDLSKIMGLSIVI